MRLLLLLTIFLVLFVSACRKVEDLDTCRLVRFVQENPIIKTFHYDFITLKDGRIEKLLSFDLNASKDTVNKVIAFFEYDSKGRVKAVRDEADLKNIKRFEGTYDGRDNAVKIVQTTNGDPDDEITVEYDLRNRPINVLSRYKLGINRSIEYNNLGNPFRVFRSDLVAPPTITEHTFDNKRNFFSGIPEIKFYWLVRPLNSFLPFGDNNIVSSKVFTFQSDSFKETESLQSKRELTYNDKGYPDKIRIIRNDPPGTISNTSTFNYDCLK